MSVFDALTWKNVIGPKEGTEAALSASSLANDTITKALQNFSTSLGAFQHSMEDRATGEILGNVMAQGTGKDALEAIKSGSIYGDINKNYINAEARAKALGAVNNLLNNDISQFKLNELMPLEIESKKLAMQEARSRMANANANAALTRQKMLEAENRNNMINQLGNFKTQEERNRFLANLPLTERKYLADKGYIDQDTFELFAKPVNINTQNTYDPNSILENTLREEYGKLQKEYNAALEEDKQANEALLNAATNLPDPHIDYVPGARELRDINRLKELFNSIPTFSSAENENAFLLGSPLLDSLANFAKNKLETPNEEGLTADDRAIEATNQILDYDYNKAISDETNNRNIQTDPIQYYGAIPGFVPPSYSKLGNFSPEKSAALNLQDQVKYREKAQTRLGEADKILREFEQNPLKKMDIISYDNFSANPTKMLGDVSAIANNVESLYKTIGFDNNQYLLENEYSTDIRSVPELILNHDGLKGLEDKQKSKIAKKVDDLASVEGVPPRIALEALAKVKGTYADIDDVNHDDFVLARKIVGDYKKPEVREKVINRNQAIKEKMGKVESIKNHLNNLELNYRALSMRPDYLAAYPDALENLNKELYYWYMQLYNEAESARKLYTEVNGN